MAGGGGDGGEAEEEAGGYVWEGACAVGDAPVEVRVGEDGGGGGEAGDCAGGFEVEFAEAGAEGCYLVLTVFVSLVLACLADFFFVVGVERKEGMAYRVESLSSVRRRV